MKKDFRMQDLSWDLNEDQIANMFPDLPKEYRTEAAESYSRYLKVVAKIYDRLEDEGKLDEVLLRAQYEKRKYDKPASQNVNQKTDDAPTTTICELGDLTSPSHQSSFVPEQIARSGHSKRSCHSHSAKPTRCSKLYW